MLDEWKERGEAATRIKSTIGGGAGEEGEEGEEGGEGEEEGEEGDDDSVPLSAFCGNTPEP